MCPYHLFCNLRLLTFCGQLLDEVAERSPKQAPVFGFCAQWESLASKKVSDHVFVPDGFLLRKRILVVARHGVKGHRGIQHLMDEVSECCKWVRPSLEQDARLFVQSCIHCVAASSRPAQTALGHVQRAVGPGEILHFDFKQMTRSKHGNQALLIMLDGLFEIDGTCGLR